MSQKLVSTLLLSHATNQSRGLFHHVRSSPIIKQAQTIHDWAAPVLNVTFDLSARHTAFELTTGISDDRRSEYPTQSMHRLSSKSWSRYGV